MVSRRRQVNRTRRIRKRNRFLWIAAEGDNKTERLYFNHLNREQSEYVIKFAPGNDTDPIHMIKSVYSCLKDGEPEDAGIVVFDTDTGESRQNIINKAKANARKTPVKLILSNPCIEIWYLLHFRYSTGAVKSSRRAKEELAEYIPGYHESRDIYPIIRDKIPEALKNANKLRRYHEQVGNRREIDQNPMTDLDQVIKLFFKKK
jgi:hypothetical protein